MMDYVWLRMMARYGNGWSSVRGERPAGVVAAEWSSLLAGLGRAEIDRGFEMDAVRGSEWPPSGPSFLAMCRGIPSFAAVESELRDTKAVRTPFTALVWSKLDGYRYRQSPTDQAARQLTIAYELAREHVLAGGALPEAPSGLIAAPEPEQRKPSNPDAAAEHMARIAELVGVGGE